MIGTFLGRAEQCYRDTSGAADQLGFGAVMTAAIVKIKAQASAAMRNLASKSVRQLQRPDRQSCRAEAAERRQHEPGPSVIYARRLDTDHSRRVIRLRPGRWRRFPRRSQVCS